VVLRKEETPNRSRLMQTKLHRARTLALEIRLRRVGFAVFEGQSRLLDWGIRRWRADADPVEATIRRMNPLLSLYAPSVVVLKRLNNSQKAKQRKRVILLVKRRLVSRSIRTHMLGRAEVCQAFRQSGGRNKYEIAAAIAGTFPELRRKLPPQRKAYQPERYNALIFDAVALALAHESGCDACVRSSAQEA